MHINTKKPGMSSPTILLTLVNYNSQRMLGVLLHNCWTNQTNTNWNLVATLCACFNVILVQSSASIYKYLSAAVLFKLKSLFT
ncbi:hypothetical protein XELAEV_18034799mg [Xenopus laevis]|uniref:Uncharacterized protein n=1 Tax=Xenopus laevis TaxID=8355 RepID=A0A974HBV3_XENLA|nr:hypothetical protein XELAEV_18034799mg [Xenopus laevis]